MTAASAYCPGHTAGLRGASVRRRNRRHMRRRVRPTVLMQDAFGYVLFGVVAFSAVVAIGSLFWRKSTYEQIGAGGFFKEDPALRPPAGGAVDTAERDEEIRQLLRARNTRHGATGGVPSGSCSAVPR